MPASNPESNFINASSSTISRAAKGVAKEFKRLSKNSLDGIRVRLKEHNLFKCVAVIKGPPALLMKEVLFNWILVLLKTIH